MQVAQGNLPEALTSNQASCCRILSVDGKQIVGYREPTKPMTAERTQRLAISAREIVTDDDRQVQRLGHAFDPADETTLLTAPLSSTIKILLN